MNITEQCAQLERVYRAIDTARAWIKACRDNERLQNCKAFWQGERAVTVKHLNSLRKTLARIKREFREERELYRLGQAEFAAMDQADYHDSLDAMNEARNAT